MASQECALNQEIPEKLYYKIGEVSQITGVEPYILRYWENEFKNIAPSRSRSKQRLYRKKDLQVILEIKKLLYDERFTIEGAKKIIQKGKRGKEPQLPIPFEHITPAALLLEVKRELEEIKRVISQTH